MKVKEPGHIYELNTLDGDGTPEVLRFVNREPGHEHSGTQTQEVLRALIDRTRHCDACIRWPGNDLIIHHLQMALVLHEARALERKVEKGQLRPEFVGVGEDGHFVFLGLCDPDPLAAPVRAYEDSMTPRHRERVCRSYLTPVSDTQGCDDERIDDINVDPFPVVKLGDERGVDS